MPVEFAWWPTESAPKTTPMYLVKGDLELADGDVTYVPDQRVVDNGWGETGSTHVVGDKNKALPRKVSLTWFSFTEDRFYAGTFALPLDRMAPLLDRGALMPASQPRRSFDTIVFGMAPGGNVSVWLSAGPVVREVATFRAQPADVPWTQVLDNPAVSRADYIREELEASLKPQGLQWLSDHPEHLTVWSDYTRRIAWTPQLAGADPRGATLWFKGLNGEKDWLDLADATRGGEPLPQTLPMPAALTLKWRSATGPLSAVIALDEKEVLSAFQKLSSVDRPGPMTLMLEPSGTGKPVDVFLRRGELAYRFANNKVEIFGSD